MSAMRSRRDWRARALVLIDQYESGVRPHLSMNSLAEQCGVSRTTIWRDVNISERLRAASSRRSLAGAVAKRGSASAARIRKLEFQLSVALEENHRLIERLAGIYVALCEQGFDPSIYIKPNDSDSKIRRALRKSLTSSA